MNEHNMLVTLGGFLGALSTWPWMTKELVHNSLADAVSAVAAGALVGAGIMSIGCAAIKRVEQLEINSTLSGGLTVVLQVATVVAVQFTSMSVANYVTL